MATASSNPQAPTPILGGHSFDGAYTPDSVSSPWASQIGFSVGVFQWVPKSSGKGLKKSAVKVRVKGWVRDAEKAYAKARELCLRLDAGESISQKSITVS